jgi:glutamine cyclotransferase
MKRIACILLIVFAISACQNNNNSEVLNNGIAQPAVLNYKVINVYPHDTSSFTEGLEFFDSNLFESSGLKQKSKLAKVDLTTGKELQRIDLAKEFFGEGITILNGKIYQLTWQEYKCFVYDLHTFKKIGEFSYEGEGWGMTNDGKHLIMNNGNNNLYFRDPETFKIVNTVGVIDNNGPLAEINELEFVDGFIFSNIWKTNYIVKIDPINGHVVAKADLSQIWNTSNYPQNENAEVMNGIAYNSKQKTFFITGKNWSKLFEIKFN